MAEAAAHGVVVAALAALAAWALQRAVTLVDLARARRPDPCEAGVAPAGIGSVTVQVPLFNEPGVCVRVVDAACALRPPGVPVEVQVLDDSSDETTALVAAAVRRWRARGVDVLHVRRETREGFKAGALAHGLALAKGDSVAIFDADFAPAPDFLERTVPLLARADMVQARWGHENRDASLLTRAQAALLDAHFAVEQRGRASAGRFFGFNGTAGVWRKQAIVDAGGWDARTLTEDLDLSVRAWGRGARFAYAADVVVPAELPDDVDAWIAQQQRWAKGALQTARARAFGRPAKGALARADVALKLTQNLCFTLLAVAVAAAPAAALAGDAWFPAAAALPALLSLALGLRGRGRRAVVDAACAVALCCALSLRIGAAAVAGALDAGDRTFHRTPKKGAPVRRRRAPWLEPVVGAAHLAAAAHLCSAGHAARTPFLWLCGAALVFVGVTGARRQGSRRRRASTSAPAARAATMRRRGQTSSCQPASRA